MKKEIKLYRVILNILFYIFYVLITSIAFTFIFPTILSILGKEILDPIADKNIFENIQYTIFIIVLIVTVIFRKFFYLPIVSKNIKVKDSESIKDTKWEIENNGDPLELNIKVGKEIK